MPGGGTFQRVILCQECKRQWDVTAYEIGQRLRCLCGFLMEVPNVRSHAPTVQHCESCGAPRKPGGAACEFCGSIPTLASSRMSLVCPFCLCRTADQSRFCQSCGTAIQPIRFDRHTGDLTCPKCARSKLVNRPIGEFVVDECPTCAGMWIAAEAFERIVNQQVSEREEKQYARRVRSFQTDSAGKGTLYVRCPICSRHMNRRNFGHASGVIIDECRDDGIWLDDEELHKIAEYVASGGLRRAKEIELQRLEERARSRTREGTGMRIALGAGDEPSREVSIDLQDFGSVLIEVVVGFAKWVAK